MYITCLTQEMGIKNWAISDSISKCTLIDSNSPMPFRGQWALPLLGAYFLSKCDAGQI